MIINTSNFKEVLKKATLNFSIDTVQLNLTKSKITSKMITAASDAITILNIPNEVLPSMKATDALVMNFQEPSNNIMPYLNLIDDTEETVINIKDEKITLVQGKQKSNIFFCAPQVVNVFDGDNLRPDISYFHTIDLDDDFVNAFSKIKKVGSKFNKVYFGVAENVLYIETSDKQNRFSNGLRVDICDVEHSELSMCFEFKNVVNLMAVLNGSYSDFKCQFAYVEDQELGMLNLGNEDNSEVYYLMSKRDNG